jgi:sortase A
VEQRVVSPYEGSVLGPDPLGTGRPTLTLTTCHPRFSNAQRLVVFAELAA